MTPVGPARAGRRTEGAPYSVTIAAFGVRVRCSVAARLLVRLRESLPPHARIVPAPMTGAAWQVRDEDELAAVMTIVELDIAEHAAGLIFVHAGAVAVAGRVLLLPGRSGAGKSTLVDALVRGGAHYLSDEFAPINADGSVVPYRRPITLRASADRPSRRWMPDDSASAAPGAALPIALVAHLRYDPRATDVWTSPGSGQVMLALIDNTVAARSRPGEMLAHHARALRGAGAVVGTRTEAEPAAARLLQLMGSQLVGRSPGRGETL